MQRTTLLSPVFLGCVWVLNGCGSTAESGDILSPLLEEQAADTTAMDGTSIALDAAQTSTRVDSATTTMPNQRVPAPGVSPEMALMPTDMGVEGAVDVGSPPPMPDAAVPTPPMNAMDGIEGAFVTRDCMYRDYPYAIDILLSCGDERFGSELRLHTFKRHSVNHEAVFNDQRLTVRDEQLWFNAYARPRCVRMDGNGRLQLSTRANECTRWTFLPYAGGHRLQAHNNGQCVGMGEVRCADHRWTGGVECGGIEHRYLPLVMGDCEHALTFTIEDRATFCANESPRGACF